MRKMPVVIVAGSALVGLAAAYYVTHARKESPSKLPPNVFVSADQHGLVELPEEPRPLAEPPRMPILLQPQPMPALGDSREVTVSLRQPVEEEIVPEPVPAPSLEPPLDVVIASPEEAPPSAELIAMPTEEISPEQMERYRRISSEAHDLATEPGCAIAKPAEEESKLRKSDPLPLPAVVFVASRPSSLDHLAMIPFTGVYPCNLQNKTKLKLPKPVRRQMSLVYVGLSPDRNCLWMYNDTGVDRLVRRMMQQKKGEDEIIRTVRVCLSRLQVVWASPSPLIDGNGELEDLDLPAELIEAAGINGDAVLIGVRDHFELWNAKSWQEYSEGKPQMDAATDRMNELLNASEEFTDHPSPVPPERTHGGIE